MPLILDRSSAEIPIWDLDDETSQRVPDNLRSYNYTHEGQGKYSDKRTAVPNSEVGPGGKYRCEYLLLSVDLCLTSVAIVKLFLHYESQKHTDWAVATGFLVRDNIVVTAGHCAYDCDFQLGRLDAVKVFVGYTGQHANGPEIEYRWGLSVAITPEWKDGNKIRADLAFIKLNKKVLTAEPIQYMDTPISGNEHLGVVGYSGDIRQDTEPGARMYEDFQQVAWNIYNSSTETLNYTIDPKGGMFPQLLVPISTHQVTI
jgi:hypothetical protein